MNRNKLSLLLAIVATCSTSLPASAQLSSGDVNLIGIGASILNSLINPPHRETEIKADAEVKKAKIAAEAEIAKEKLRIAADKVTPLLARWGVSRTNCAPGLVFINGIDANTVCIQPSQTITKENTHTQAFTTLANTVLLNQYLCYFQSAKRRAHAFVSRRFSASATEITRRIPCACVSVKTRQAGFCRSRQQPDITQHASAVSTADELFDRVLDTRCESM